MLLCPLPIVNLSAPSCAEGYLVAAIESDMHSISPVSDRPDSTHFHLFGDAQLHVSPLSTPDISGYFGTGVLFYVVLCGFVPLFFSATLVYFSRFFHIPRRAALLVLTSPTEPALHTRVSGYLLNAEHIGQRKLPVPCRADGSFVLPVLRCNQRLFPALGAADDFVS